MTRLLAADRAGIDEAAGLLRAGRLVAFGTETVYGLGADATDALAVARVFAAKGRPAFNPLICHYPDPERAFADVVANDAARALAAFWPGPLTLVLPRRETSRVALLAAAGLDSLGVRVPRPAAARALLARAGVPVAAPSANRSGRISPTSAAHVIDDLSGTIDVVLDTGPCEVGVESTVVDLTGPPALLRPGGVPREAIEDAIGPLAEAGPVLRGPGMLASHYAPVARLRLDAFSVAGHEALLAFGPPLEGAAATFQLSVRGDPGEAAARLFEGLRQLDRACSAGLSGIAAMPVPGGGLAPAIRDRLRRAAAPR